MAHGSHVRTCSQCLRKAWIWKEFAIDDAKYNKIEQAVINMGKERLEAGVPEKVLPKLIGKIMRHTVDTFATYFFDFDKQVELLPKGRIHRIMHAITGKTPVTTVDSAESQLGDKIAVSGEKAPDSSERI